MTETELKRFTELLKERIATVINELGGFPQIVFAPGQYGFENAIGSYVVPEGVPPDMAAALVQEMRTKYPVVAFATEAWMVGTNAKEELEIDSLENHPDRIESIILVIHNKEESHFWTAVINRVGDEAFINEWEDLEEEYRPSGTGLLNQPYRPPASYN
jgi:hypothetical protein